MAFALKEQHAALSERRDALEKELKAKTTAHREARKEVRDALPMPSMTYSMTFP